jgi:hypothetical protein
MPFLSGSFAYLTWKYNYYGDLLPSFYYIKLLSKPDVGDGFKYVIKFILSYFAFPFLAIPFIFLINKTKVKLKLNFFNSTLLFILILWVWYVIKLGGGTKEYSLMMPMIPLLILLISGFIRNRLGINAFIFISSIFILSSFAHKKFMYEWGTLKSVKYLKQEIVAPNHDLISAGINLNYYFDYGDVALKTRHYGVIGYYSKLYTIDKEGILQRGLGYKKDVNIDLYTNRLLANEDISSLSIDNILVIPVNTAYSLTGVYDNKNKKIDSLISEGVFKYFE